jgi:phospholipase/lecithinase/hemolysin
MNRPCYRFLYIGMMIGCLLPLTAFSQLKPMRRPIEKIVSFGDSLSDNGNLYALTQWAHSIDSDEPVIPKNPPYYQGHFSNGPVWVENLTRTIFPKAKLKNKLLDYAMGGAWAESRYYSGQSIPFSLWSEVEEFNNYLSHGTDYNKSNYLYTVWIGANDFLNGRDDVPDAVKSTIAETESQIKKLLDNPYIGPSGGRVFLIANLPDLALTPRGRQGGKAFSENLHQLTLQYNHAQQQMVSDLQAYAKQNHYQAKFIVLDIFDMFNQLIHSPTEQAQFGLTNVTTPCFTGSYVGAENRKTIPLLTLNNPQQKSSTRVDILRNPSLAVAYQAANMHGTVCSAEAQKHTLFWDHVHPTALTHRIIAYKACVLLQKNHAILPNVDCEQALRAPQARTIKSHSVSS